MSPLPAELRAMDLLVAGHTTCHAEELPSQHLSGNTVKPSKPMTPLATLAEKDPRWRRLLCDPEGLFIGGEAISEEYERYLSDILSLMEMHTCTFKQAVMLASAMPDASNYSDLGVVDYLKMRKAGYPLADALIYNLKASSVGPSRAGVCAWRRKEARSALSRGARACALAEAALAQGLDCAERELAAAERALGEAQRLCGRLDHALEVLEANSRTCGEGPEVLAEYAELQEEAGALSSRAAELAERAGELRAGAWSWEYLGSVVRYLLAPGARSRCCTPLLCSQPSSMGPFQNMYSQGVLELRVEVLAATDLLAWEHSFDTTIFNGVELQGAAAGDWTSHVPSDIYVEAELSGCRRATSVNRPGFFTQGNMLFAYSGEPTLHIQVFEPSRAAVPALLSGDLLIGDAYMLLDPPAEDGTPRAMELPIRRGEQPAGVVLLRYHVIAH